MMGDRLHLPRCRAELMRMATTRFYTADMVRALPDDGNRYETVRGELLVTPAPRAWHQAVVLRLAMALSRYTSRVRVGYAYHSPADISWTPDTLV
jgi:Uma2 family endonuclease